MAFFNFKNMKSIVKINRLFLEICKYEIVDESISELGCIYSYTKILNNFAFKIGLDNDVHT